MPAAGSSTATNTIITVNFLTARSQVLSWYATGNGAIQATLSNGSNEVFRLFDMRGRLLKQGSLQNGQVIFSGLIPGMYILQVNAAAGLITEKIVLSYN